MNLKTPEEYGYIMENNLCLFTKGPLSNWWGGFSNQIGKFSLRMENIKMISPYNKDVHQYIENLYIDKLSFNCVEQWMMAAKAAVMDDLETFKLILAEKHPAKQKDLGRLVKNYDEILWAEKRVEIVYWGVIEKFKQNSKLKNWFIHNFHRHTIFAEASPWDSIWGIGMDSNNPDSRNINTWKGKNLLGEVLQFVRKNIES